MPHFVNRLRPMLFLAPRRAALNALIGICLVLPAMAGPLDPPAAPAPTDSIRLPGTPISTVPYTISAPGRYYVTRSLSSPGAAAAITVASSFVSLDLGGFLISGLTTPGSAGIRISGPIPSNVTVENGTIIGFNIGLDIVDSGNNVRLRNLVATNNVRGFSLKGNYLEISDCVANQNSETGIFLNGATFSIIRNCSAVQNSGDGITVGGNDNVVMQSRALTNSLADIRVTSFQNVIRDNVVGNIVLESAGRNVVIDNVCLDLDGLTDTAGTPPNTTSAADHNNVGCN